MLLPGNRLLNYNRISVVDQLTPMEQRIWDLHMQGLPRREIAAKLGLAPNSVGAKLTVAREKMEVQKHAMEGK